MPSRILIADDNPAVRTAIRQLLEAPGREIVDAADGAEAVSKALEFRPEVAILDLAMPTMDGLNAAREISKQNPDTVVLMCTMHWSPQLLTEAQKYGVRKVISKAAGGELVSSVDELLTQKAATEVAVPVPSPALVLPPDTLHPLPLIAETAVVAEPEPAVDIPPDVPPDKMS